MITVLKEVEITIHSDEVDLAMMQAAPFDKLSLMVRMAPTITNDNIKEIRDLIGEVAFNKAIVPLVEFINTLK